MAGGAASALRTRWRRRSAKSAWGRGGSKPARRRGSTDGPIDWARLEEQPSDDEPWTMSALDDGVCATAAVLRDHPDECANS